MENQTNAAILILEKEERAYDTRLISGDEQSGYIECVIDNPTFCPLDGCFVHGKYSFLPIFHEQRNITDEYLSAEDAAIDIPIHDIYKIEYVFIG